MPFSMPSVDQYREEALTHLKNLVRIDTSNPPGNELKACDYVAEALKRDGLEPRVFESAPGRGNVWCKLPGDGTGNPLMLIAHLDVVPADPVGWTHPPFAAEESGGFVYGRGTIDMKQMAAMSMTTMAVLKRAGYKGKRDLILCFTADEEEAGTYGAGWMVQNQPELIKAEYALGEVGGFSMEVGNRRVYPVMTGEKGVVRLKARARGQGGHGSMPVKDNAISKLGLAAYRFSAQRLPVRITPLVATFIRVLASVSGPVKGPALRSLLVPQLTDFVLDTLVRDPERVRSLSAMLHNTVSPTIIQAGSKDNVIPTQAEMDLDGRYLPGVTIEEFLDEVREAAGPGVEIVLDRYMGPLEAPFDTPLFEAIKRAILRTDPGALVTPFMISGFTDAKHYSTLGIKTYGFTPCRLPPDMPFASLFHAVDERIPVEGFVGGTTTLMNLVADFCG
jgi:acetylornithine deacetylase/succinyl-diaminopimelate desuccinylase-like protein